MSPRNRLYFRVGKFKWNNLSLYGLSFSLIALFWIFSISLISPRMDEYAEEKRTEKNLIVCSGISEAETTNNKRLRSTFCIEATQTRSIASRLCDSRASCYKMFVCCVTSHFVV